MVCPDRRLLFVLGIGVGVPLNYGFVVVLENTLAVVEFLFVGVGFAELLHIIVEGVV